MNDSEKRQADQRGYGEVKAFLHTAKILHDGWEMDNTAWIVALADGSRAALTTNHGGVYP